ncbi:MAG: sterol desaturase family protein [Burkholderiales bacterium]|nr:sterol desaturase family protein [Burkholderiales bacterium]
MTCFNELLFTAAATWPVVWLLDLVRYLIGAALIVAVLDIASAGWIRRRLVRIRNLAEGQKRREFWQSMLTVVVFSLVGTSVLVGYHLGVSKLYFTADEYGWAWLGASFVVLVILHDAWFYWTHRLMHHARVFHWSHRTHHLSVAPTPWTAYSFSAAEAFVQALYLPVVLLVVPAHQAVIFAWMAWMVLRNVMGHSGVELLPRSWLAGWWGRWLTTTLHHEMHHAYGRFNYGLYFVWWDRLCATEHPEYRPRLERLVAEMDIEEAGDAPVAIPR